jgi:hypothetical protein
MGLVPLPIRQAGSVLSGKTHTTTRETSSRRSPAIRNVAGSSNNRATRAFVILQSEQSQFRTVDSGRFLGAHFCSA